MSLAEDIKAYALDIGYTHVGIAPADDFSGHATEIASRGDLYDFYIQDPRQFMEGALPQRKVPWAKSIICLVWDYAQKAFPERLLGKIGRIYQARCYGPPPQRINGARYQLMLQFVEKLGCRIAHNVILPERRAAARAGVITFGKNNFAYARGSGSFVVLSSILVDKKLQFDRPTLKVNCPEDCTACMDACPTGAIYAPLKLNPRRCISFNNWWTQNGRPPDITSCIPHDLRKNIGTRVHGCDVCQEVCPRNQLRMKEKLPKDPFLENIAKGFSLTKMLHMTDNFFHKSVHPLMYNYIREKKYFQRNAAIAIGNLGNPKYLPDLVEGMSVPHDTVRSHAAWALGQIGGNTARTALSKVLHAESSSWVRKEIEMALDSC